MILLPLCETIEDRHTALGFARSPACQTRPEVLIAVPQPLEMLRSMVLQAQRWQWVADHTPELVHDRYAAEEVSRQLAAARRVLRDRVQDLVGLSAFVGRTELEWFRLGARIPVPSGRALLSTLSDVCDEVYPRAPRVRNELVNRRELSSAAAAARMRLIERLLTSAALPLLGMDARKKPPEMSMYLSVLRHGNLHVEQNSVHAVVAPPAGQDPLNVLPTFNRILEILREVPDARVTVTTLFDALRQSPYGVRDGLLPLLLAVLAVVHEQELAFYEDGAFLRRVGGEEFMRSSRIRGRSKSSTAISTPSVRQYLPVWPRY